MNIKEMPIGLIYRGFEFKYLNYSISNIDNEVIRATNKKDGFTLELNIDRPVREIKNELKSKIDSMFEHNIIRH